jgi:hypothetical protein
VIFALALLAFALLAILRLPAVWSGRNTPAIEAALRGGWPFGDALLRGWVRALPVGIVGFATLALAVVVITLIDDGTLGPGSALQPLALVAFPLIAAFVGCIGLTVSVILLNRPRFAVSPALRDEPGAIAEWHGATTGRSKR